jgi:hypothetical protein
MREPKSSTSRWPRLVSTFETGWRAAPMVATFWPTVENKGAQTAASVDQAAGGWVFRYCFVIDVGYLCSEEVNLRFVSSDMDHVTWWRALGTR